MGATDMMDWKQKPLLWERKEYMPGPISRQMYREFEYIAEYSDDPDSDYIPGITLEETAIWSDRYSEGFCIPDDDCGYLAFATDVYGDYYYLGRFAADDLIGPQTSWDVRKWEMMMRARQLDDERGIAIMRDIYFDPHEAGNRTPEVDRIAMDDECLQWYADYWNFLEWDAHGEVEFVDYCTMQEIADTIYDPDYLLDEYLNTELGIGPAELDNEMNGLAERLVHLHQKHKDD